VKRGSWHEASRRVSGRDSDIGNAMAKLGRPPLPHPRRHGTFVRFSDTEWGALERALVVEHPVATRRPTLPEWIRDLVVAHAAEILGVDVSRAALRRSHGGAPDWKRWRLARAVRRAASRKRRRSKARR
jgi:hypothetical protein